MNDYYTYRVRITDKSHVRIEKRALDGREFGEPRGQLRFTDATRHRLDELQELMYSGEVDPNDNDYIRELGELLFSILFDERLSEDFFTFFKQVKKDSNDSLLRFEINVDERVLPEIAALPWEFLSIPINLEQGSVWLSTFPDIILSRWRDHRDPPTNIAIQPGQKLRIAVVVAAPTDLGPVQYDHLWQQLQKLVQGWEVVELLPLIDTATRQTVDDVLSQKPHILHFIGHGQFNDGHPQIALVDNIRGEADWVDSQTFAEYFSIHSDCIVLLQSCESAILSSKEPFIGIASHLIQQKVPVVVAMQYEVSNATAQTFAEIFYKRIFGGDSVDVAVQKGRRAIAKKKGYRSRDFGTPVLFMRAHRLFQLSAPATVANERINKPTATLPLQFSNLIADKTTNFVGRQYIFDDINHFIGQNRKGYCIIEGDPGAGKTAILAKFVKDTNAIAHFNIHAQSINKAHQFLETICQQITKRYQLPYPMLPPEATRDGAFLAQILLEASDKLSEDEKLVICVDALDEVDNTGHIGNMLFLPSTLPNGVYFVLTTRRFAYELVVDTPITTLNLNNPEYNQGIDRDIMQYILDATRRNDLVAWLNKQNLNINEFVTTMSEKSERNFIYLTLVLGDIEKGNYANLDIVQLPQGLEKYYDRHWNIMGMRPKDSKELPREKLRIIYIICELREPLSRHMITDFARTDGMEIDELAVQGILDEWEQFMHEQEIDLSKRYSLYHTSFRDFLHQKDVVQAASLTIEEINKLIADNLWRDLFGDE